MYIDRQHLGPSRCLPRDSRPTPLEAQDLLRRVLAQCRAQLSRVTCIPFSSLCTTHNSATTLNAQNLHPGDSRTQSKVNFMKPISWCSPRPPQQGGMFFFGIKARMRSYAQKHRLGLSRPISGL